MHLYKFCKPQHNLLSGCNSLRFGTLEYYRTLDPSFSIADSDEGVDTHDLDFDPKIPADEETIEFLQSLKFFPPDASLEGFRVRMTSPNCYIWCCKLSAEKPSNADGTSFDPTYSSWYRIDNSNVFADYLGGLLTGFVRRVHFAPEAIQRIDAMSVLVPNRIQLLIFHGPVIYVEKKEGRLSLGKFESYAPQIPQSMRSIFVKTAKYSTDGEYRFAFMFVDQQGRALPVAPGPIDIQALPVSV